MVESTRTLQCVTDEISLRDAEIGCVVKKDKLHVDSLQLQAEMEALKNAYIVISQQLAQSKTENARLACELVGCAEREDEMREYIDELKLHISAALGYTDTLSEDFSNYALKEKQDIPRIDKSRLLDVENDSMSSSGICEDFSSENILPECVHPKWQ